MGTITHAKVSAIADDAAASAAGQVVPSDWNAAHVISLTKSDVGLANVDNTADTAKPVSTATQTALDAKQATLVSGTNLHSVNGLSLLGSGDLIPIPVYTWAGVPDPTTNAGRTVRISDYGVAGVGLAMISDGTRWLPNGPQLLFASAVSVSVTGTTSETALATVPVPSGSMGLNGELLAEYTSTFTNNANNKTLREKLGATTLRTQVGTTAVLWMIRDAIRNKASASSQSLAQSVMTVSGMTNAQNTSAVDTSVANDFVLTAQLATGTDTFTLANLRVWLLP